MYQPEYGATNITACLACPKNSFQPNAGSASCYTCSSSSTSTEKSTLCTCIGQNRAFQPDDGYCVCKPGYEFVDSNLIVSSENDGSYDCQPIVYSRCITGEYRDHLGGCTSASAACLRQCGSGGGSFDSTTGVCQCSNITQLVEICDSDCRSSQPYLTCNSSTVIKVTYPTTNVVDYVSVDDISAQGLFDCTSGASVYSMSTSSGDFEGIYGLGSSISSVLQSSTLRRRLAIANETGGIALDQWQSIEFHQQQQNYYRRLLSSTSNVTDIPLTNPLTCIIVGTTVLFDISNENYPVYVKDSLLNTNPSFDYSYFRDLQTLSSSTLTLKTFAFTFQEAGTYVFKLSSSSSTITIISVVAKNLACTTAGTFVEFTTANLVSLGISSNDSIVLEPDWALVAGLLAGMLGLVLIVIGFLYYFRKKAWSTKAKYMESYRNTNKKMSQTSNLPSKSAAIPKNKVAPGLSTDNERDELSSTPNSPTKRDDLEAAIFSKLGTDYDKDIEFEDDIMIPELAKSIQAHREEIDKQLSNQTGLLSTLKETLQREVDDLKNLLSVSALDHPSLLENPKASKRLESHLQRMKSDSSQRDMFDVNASLIEQQVMNSILHMDRLLQLGPELIANEIVEQMLGLATEAANRDMLLNEDSLQSSTLHEIIHELQSIKSMVEASLIPFYSDEKRRSSISLEAIETSIKQHHVVIPYTILDAWKQSRDADMNTDVCIDYFVSTLKTFAERTPKFSTVMTNAENALGKTLCRMLEKGNMTGVDDETKLSRELMTSYLRELIDVIKALEQKCEDRFTATNDSREHGHLARKSFESLIESELNALRESNTAPLADKNQELLTQLLDALRQGKVSDILSSLPQKEEDIVDDYDPEQDVDTLSPLETKPSTANTAMQFLLSEESAEAFIEENEKLHQAEQDLSELESKHEQEVLSQTVELLNTSSAENDQRVIDNILELERRAQEEAIAKIMEAYADNLAPEYEDEAVAMELERQELAERELELQEELQQIATDQQDETVVADSSKTSSVGLQATYRMLLLSEYKASFNLDSESILQSVQCNVLSNIFSDVDIQVDALHSNMTSVCASNEKKLEDILAVKDNEIDSPAALINTVQESEDRLIKRNRDIQEQAMALLTDVSASLDAWQSTLVSSDRRTYGDRVVEFTQQLTTTESEKLSTFMNLRAEDSDTSNHEIVASMMALAKLATFHDNLRSEVASLSIRSEILAKAKAAFASIGSFDLRRQQVIRHQYEVGGAYRASSITSIIGLDNFTPAAPVSAMPSMLAIDVDGVLTALNAITDADEMDAYLVSQVQRLCLELCHQLVASLSTLSVFYKQFQSTVQSQLLQSISEVFPTFGEEKRKLCLYLLEKDFESFSLQMKVHIVDLFRDFSILHSYLAMLGISISPNVNSSKLREDYLFNLAARGRVAAKAVNISRHREHQRLKALHQKDLEAARLIDLCHPIEDLEAIYEKIDATLSSQIQSIDDLLETDMQLALDEMNDALRARLEIHDDYRSAAAPIAAKYQSILTVIDTETTLETSSQYIQSSIEYEANLLKAFQTTMEKFSKQDFASESSLQLEEQLRTDSDRELCDTDKNQRQRLEDLMKSHVRRREDAKALLDEYEMEIVGLEKLMQAKKERQAELLRKRLDKRKNARINDLIKQGFSPQDAEKIAEDEYQKDMVAETAALEERIARELDHRKIDLQALMKQELEKQKENFANAMTSLEDGLQAAHEREKRSLEKKLADRRNKRLQELQSQGLSSTEASDKLEKEEIALSMELFDLQEDSKRHVTEFLQSAHDEDIQRLRDSFENSCTELEESCKADQEKQLYDLHDRLLADEAQRIEELVQTGLSPDDARTQAHNEMIEKEKQGSQDIAEGIRQRLELEKQALQSKFDMDLKKIGDRHEASIAILQNGLLAHRDQELKRTQERLAQRKQQRLRELEQAGLSPAAAEERASTEMADLMAVEVKALDDTIDQAKLDTSAAMEDYYKKKAQAIELQHECKLQGFEAYMALKKSTDALRTKENLAKRRQARAALRLSTGSTVEDVDRLSAAEEIADNHTLARLESISQQEMEAELQDRGVKLESIKQHFDQLSEELKKLEEYETSSVFGDISAQDIEKIRSNIDAANRAMEVAKLASQLNKDQSEKELNDLRQRYEEEREKIEKAMDEKHRLEQSSLQKRLEKRRQAREQELASQGLSSKEIAQQIESEDLYAYQDLNETMNKEKHEQIAAIDQQQAEEEKELIDRHRQRAAADTAAALANKQAAQSKLEELRKLQEDESKRLEDDLRAQRKKREDVLRNRLAEKKNHILSQKELSDETRKSALNELAIEESQTISTFEQQEALAAQKARQSTKAKHALALRDIVQQVKKAELEAQVMTAKELSLKNLQEQKQKAQQSLYDQEVQRMKMLHQQQELKRINDESAQRSVTNKRLADRLAAKKMKKDAKQIEQESKDLAERSAKQAQDLLQREQLREQKIIWSEALQQVLDKVATMPISLNEKEDYCYQELLVDKQIVPANHIAEVVGRIQHRRHANEMAELLRQHFDTRIQLLKDAVEKVIAEKNAAKADLLQRVGKEVSEDDLRQELAKLEEEYAARQHRAEKEATGKLEEQHMQEQLQLRQRQFEDTAKIAALYTNPDSIQQLQSMAVSSHVQDIASYRAKLEADKLAREAALAADRQAMEASMKQAHEEEMKRIQEQINEERRKAQEEIEKKKLEVSKQREELEKKQLQELGELDNMEKSRILASFEKESAAISEALEMGRKTQKAKLQDRLAERRKTRASIAQLPFEAPTAEMLAAANAASAGLSAPSTAPTTPHDTRKPTFKEPEQPPRPKGFSKKSTAETVVPSQLAEIESKLERIEKIMSVLQSQVIANVTDRSPTPQPSAEVTVDTAVSRGVIGRDYHDDNEPVPGESVEIIPDEEVHIQERARLEFGKRLAAMLGLRGLTIKVASSLPASAASNNAFRNSYNYHWEDDTLFVHNNRLSSSGDFGLVIIHALSHIKTNPKDMSDDADPVFLAEFYKNLKILSQDLYKKSSIAVPHLLSAAPGALQRAPSTSSDSNPPGPMLSPRMNSILETRKLKLGASFRGVPTASSTPRRSSLDGAPTPVTGLGIAETLRSPMDAASDYFSDESLAERLKMYAKKGGLPADYVNRYHEYAKTSKKQLPASFPNPLPAADSSSNSPKQK
jgi:hypothetical protein